MTEQRMVPVELLLGAAIIAEDDGAYHTASALRAIIDGPGVEPFAYYVYFPDAQDGEFCDDLDDLIDRMTNERHEVTPLYCAAPSDPAPEWPVLDKPALVGGGRFHVGVSARLVVEAAQRHYEYEVTPEKEADRIAKAAKAIDALVAPAQAVPDVEEIRRRFEQEYVVNPQTYRRNEYGDYVLPSIQDAWAGWKAAMLAAAPQPPATAHPSAVACPTGESK